MTITRTELGDDVVYEGDAIGRSVRVHRDYENMPTTVKAIDQLKLADLNAEWLTKVFVVNAMHRMLGEDE